MGVVTRLWALDLRDRWPVLAHLITEHTADGDRLTGGKTACGRSYDPFMQGCWATDGENLPLQPHAVHCGAETVAPQHVTEVSTDQCAPRSRLRSTPYERAQTPDRCASCDHTWDMHQPEGCWYTVTHGRLDADLVCPCSEGRTQSTVDGAPETVAPQQM